MKGAHSNASNHTVPAPRQREGRSAMCRLRYDIRCVDGAQAIPKDLEALEYELQPTILL